MAPTQAIAIEEDYAARLSLFIDPRLAMALCKKGLKLVDLVVGQPGKLVAITPVSSGVCITKQQQLQVSQRAMTLVRQSALCTFSRQVPLRKVYRVDGIEAH